MRSPCVVIFFVTSVATSQNNQAKQLIGAKTIHYNRQRFYRGRPKSLREIRVKRVHARNHPESKPPWRRGPTTSTLYPAGHRPREERAISLRSATMPDRVYTESHFDAHLRHASVLLAVGDPGLARDLRMRSELRECCRHRNPIHPCSKFRIRIALGRTPGNAG